MAPAARVVGGGKRPSGAKCRAAPSIDGGAGAATISARSSCACRSRRRTRAASPSSASPPRSARAPPASRHPPPSFARAARARAPPTASRGAGRRRRQRQRRSPVASRDARRRAAATSRQRRRDARRGRTLLDGRLGALAVHADRRRALEDADDDLVAEGRSREGAVLRLGHIDEPDLSVCEGEQLRPLVHGLHRRRVDRRRLHERESTRAQRHKGGATRAAAAGLPRRRHRVHPPRLPRRSFLLRRLEFVGRRPSRAPNLDVPVLWAAGRRSARSLSRRRTFSGVEPDISRNASASGSDWAAGRAATAPAPTTQRDGGRRRRPGARRRAGPARRRRAAGGAAQRGACIARVVARYRRRFWAAKRRAWAWSVAEPASAPWRSSSTFIFSRSSSTLGPAPASP